MEMIIRFADAERESDSIIYFNSNREVINIIG